MEEEKAIGASSAVVLETAKSMAVDPTLEKHAHDADEAMKAFEELHGEAIELDEATNKRLLRIIDWHMMPIMCCIYGMNYLDSMYFLTILDTYHLSCMVRFVRNGARVREALRLRC